MLKCGYNNVMNSDGLVSPGNSLSHVIVNVGNQDLSQDDTTLRNVSLVVTAGQDSIADYRFVRIHFTLPAETSLIDWILLSDVQLCGREAGMCLCMPFQRLHKMHPNPWNVM